MSLQQNSIILQRNIKGFINNKHDLELIITKHKPNIITLQEKHIVQKNLHMLHLPGFHIFHHNKSNNGEEKFKCE